MQCCVGAAKAPALELAASGLPALQRARNKLCDLTYDACQNQSLVDIALAIVTGTMASGALGAAIWIIHDLTQQLDLTEIWK